MSDPDGAEIVCVAAVSPLWLMEDFDFWPHISSMPVAAPCQQADAAKLKSHPDGLLEGNVPDFLKNTALLPNYHPTPSH